MLAVRDLSRVEVLADAKRLVSSIYRLTRRLPDDERFGLTTQMRRASVSVPANIAEGLARGSEGELERFLRIASGSVAELEVLLELAHGLFGIDTSSVARDADVVRRRLNVFARRVSAQRRS